MEIQVVLEYSNRTFIYYFYLIFSMTEDKIQVTGFQEMSTVDGDGNRFVIFFSGCSHACDECHNVEAQNPGNGMTYDIDDLILKIKEVIEWHEGITLSGGDPLFQEDKLIILLDKIRKDEKLKHINVWLYTGYLFEKVSRKVKSYVDMIVDGKYNKNLKPIKFRGSANQNLWSKYKSTNKFVRRTYNGR